MYKLREITIILSLFIVSCNSKKEELLTNNYSIDATITGFHDSTKVFVYVADISITNPKPVDSAIIINEKFRFEGIIKEPFPAVFFFKGGTQSKYPVINFWMDTVNITIKADLDDFKRDFENFKKYQLKGSEVNKLRIESYENTAYLNKTNQRELIIDEKIRIIFSSPNNFFSIQEAHNLRYILLKKNLLIKFYNSLENRYRNSTNGKLIAKLVRSKQIGIGELFTNIIAKDLDENLIKLSDYKGKTILLDFWSTNCPPCRKQIKNEFPILKEKYKNEDFVIVSYSLDTDYKIWKNTSASDGIDWVNITDLKGYKSDNVINYQVSAIPKTIIIDKNGIINYTKVGYVEGDLEQKLDKIFSREE